MHKFIALRLGLCAPAPENPGSISGDSKLTLGQQLSAAQSDVTRLTAELATANAEAGKITGLQATITAKETVISTLQGQLTEANGKIAKLEADAKASADLLTEAQGKITTLEATEKDITIRAGVLAKEQLKAMGVDASKLPKPSDDNAPKTGSAAALEAFQKEADPDKKAGLYKAYQHAIAAEKKA